MDASRSVAVGFAANPPERPTTVCGRVCLAAFFLGVGLFAGAIAFVAIARYGATFQLSPEVAQLEAQEYPSADDVRIVEAARRVRNYQNTALSVAILGAVAGGAFGLAAGLRCKTAAAAGGGLVGGLLLGAAFGTVGGLAELYLGYRLWSLRFAPKEFERTFKTMAAHSTAFLIAGVGIGLAAGLAARQVRHHLASILAAALIAGLAYPGLAAAAFPVENTDAVVPPVFGPLLLWTVMPIALMGLALGRTKAVRPGPGRPVA